MAGDARRQRAERRAAELHESVLAQGTGHRSASVAAGAWLLAFVVYASTLALIPLAVWCAVGIRFRVLGIGLAALLLWILWQLRPRAPRTPDEGRLAPQDGQHLRELVDRVSTAVGTAAPRTIVLDPHINAGVYDGSRRDGRVLVLGVPLWLALDPQARVALMAHELGHFASGDTRRSRWVAGALGILQGWRHLLLPSPNDDVIQYSDNAFAMVASLFARGAMWVVGLVPMALGTALMRLTMRDSRAAEYRADGIAVDVAGRRGVLELLELISRTAGLEAPLQRASLAPGGDVIAAAAGHRPEGPAPEQPVEALDPYDSHPPSRMRLDAVRQGPDPTPAVVVDGALSHAIDAELEPTIRVVERRIRDGYR